MRQACPLVSVILRYFNANTPQSPSSESPQRRFPKRAFRDWDVLDDASMRCGKLLTRLTGHQKPSKTPIIRGFLRWRDPAASVRLPPFGGAHQRGRFPLSVSLVTNNPLVNSNPMPRGATHGTRNLNLRRNLVSIETGLGRRSSPPDDAAWTNMRLGQVGPGIEACQLSQTANSLARAFSTGSWSGR